MEKRGWCVLRVSDVRLMGLEEKEEPRMVFGSWLGQLGGCDART